MKKYVFFCLLSAIVGMMVTGCSSCQSENKKQNTYLADDDSVAPDMSANAEYIIALHRQTMNAINDGNRYYWYETKFTFADTLRVETLADAVLTEITSTFQTYGPELVYSITTNPVKGTLIPVPTPGLWIEDCDLSREEIKLSLLDVLARLTEVNITLPPGKAIYLREPVGPLDCNAQYVIGNPFETVWVDAVTGDVSTSCPAFPPTLEIPLDK